MKKFIICMAFVLGGILGAKAEAQKEDYDFTGVKIEYLARYLGLSKQQKLDMEDIHSSFINDMNDAWLCTDRKGMAIWAVRRNVMYVKMVLDKDQLRKYLVVLNATMRNRGIDLT